MVFNRYKKAPLLKCLKYFVEFTDYGNCTEIFICKNRHFDPKIGFTKLRWSIKMTSEEFCCK